MEEKNNTMKMPKQEAPKKLSYEELENVAHQLSEQARTMYKQLQEANLVNTFKRLDYLFKILELKENFNNTFVSKAIAEIEDIMTVPEPEETPTPEK